MHIVSKNISYNNITGEAQGKGKISLRINQDQENIVQDRMVETPNLKANKVDATIDKFNKKTDYSALTCTKWNTNNLALESKHFKDKDMDTRERFLKEFGDSNIFGTENNARNYNLTVNNEMKANIK